MELSGHKTQRVFDRYIVSDEDLAAAIERLQGYLRRKSISPEITRIAQDV